MSNFMIEFEDTRRPCIDKDGNKCLFHCWSIESNVIAPSILQGGHPGGTISGILGIVEYEDGSIKKLYPESFKFDDGGMFGDFGWLSDFKKEENNE